MLGVSAHTAAQNSAAQPLSVRLPKKGTQDLLPSYPRLLKTIAHIILEYLNSIPKISFAYCSVNE